ncbi:hypothetical protein DPMN_054607 [Dreissena polymorpha]|uniref:Uncharacterized protein n=1 Tax=Dreissena polymorpha TaxID=45954 RepID=A0A9D4CQP0_DREPO|nr:hypothetical protein DPMN_054607 [Dreissena polymorpha]
MIPGVKSITTYQEALLVKLCAAFLDFTTKFGIAQVLCWTALKKDNLIREIVFNKQRVMQNMRIQLPDITRHKLTARPSITEPAALYQSLPKEDAVG